MTAPDRQIVCRWVVASSPDDAAEQAQARVILNATLDAVRNALVGISRDGRIHTFNRAAEAMFGYTGAQVKGRDLAVLMPAFFDGRAEGRGQHDPAGDIRRWVGRPRDITARSSAGEAFPVQISMSETQVSGEPTFIASIHDLSAAREMEQQIRHQEDLLAEMSRVARIGAWELDARTDKLMWSDEIYRIHEVAPGTPVTVEQAIDFYAPDARPVIRRAVERGVTEGVGWDVELPLITAGGRRRWVHAMGRVDRSATGKPCRLFGTFQDITSARDTGRELKQLSERLKLATQAARIGIWDWQLTTGRVDWDDLMFQIYRVDKTRFAHGYQDWRSVVLDEDLARTEAEVYRALTGRSEFATTFRIRWPDGEVRTLKGHATVQRDEAGRPVRMTGANWDITAEERAEAHLRQSQKMEALGHLTGGLAHDFNNLMGSVRLNLETALERAGDAPAVARPLTRALDTIRRGADLTWSLLAFARRQELRNEPVRLDLFVRDLEELLTVTLGDRIALDMALDNAWSISVDPALLQSSILNLALNARDAMPDGGRLTIETRDLPAGEPGPLANGGAPDGDHVLLRMQDTGVGISKEHLDRVFDPFFSAKSSRRGTGLGLSMVHGFVQQSGGQIRINSAPLKGTEVIIAWPRALVASHAQDQQDQQDQPAPGRAHAGTIRRILLVEDDAGFADGVGTLLRTLGFDTVSVHTGAQALGRIARDRSIDLVLTDIVLPGAVSGLDVAVAAHAARPPIKSILMSGYPAEQLPAGTSRDVAGQILRKPFGRDEIMARLGQLARTGPPPAADRRPRAGGDWSRAKGVG